jgi:hypothetical protein
MDVAVSEYLRKTLVLILFVIREPLVTTATSPQTSPQTSTQTSTQTSPQTSTQTPPQDSCRFSHTKGVIDLTSLGRRDGRPQYADQIPPTGSNYSMLTLFFV